MYEEIYRAWKNEIENSSLQPLQRDFYSRSSVYMKRLLAEKENLDEKSLKFRLVTGEYGNARKLMIDLCNLRFKKIAALAYESQSVPETTLTDEEELFFENLLNASTHFSRTSRDIVEGQLITIETPKDEKKPKRILVRFTRDIPAIIGVDMKPYGPFKSEDVATLPLENVENLVKQGVAIKLEVDQ